MLDPVYCSYVTSLLKIDLVMNSSSTELNIYHWHIGLIMNKRWSIKQGQCCSKSRPSVSPAESWNQQQHKKKKQKQMGMVPLVCFTDLEMHVWVSGSRFKLKSPPFWQKALAHSGECGTPSHTQLHSRFRKKLTSFRAAVTDTQLKAAGHLLCLDRCWQLSQEGHQDRPHCLHLTVQATLIFTH